MGQQALHGGVKFLSILNIKAKPERVLKAFWGLIGNGWLPLTSCELIEPMQERFTTAFTQGRRRNIEQLPELP